MNSCHEEGVRDRNQAGIEAAEPALRDRHDVRKTNGKGHLKVWWLRDRHDASILARFRSRTPS
eukprot:gene26666-biopygen17108